MTSTIIDGAGGGPAGRIATLLDTTSAIAPLLLLLWALFVLCRKPRPAPVAAHVPSRRR